MVTTPPELRNDQVEEQHLFPACQVLVVPAAAWGWGSHSWESGAGSSCWRGRAELSKGMALAPLSVANPSTCTLGPILTFLTGSGSGISPHPFLPTSFTQAFHLVQNLTVRIHGNEPCVYSVVFNSLWSHGLQTSRLLCPWVFRGRILEWVAISSEPCVSYHCSRFFTWATEEALCSSLC